MSASKTLKIAVVGLQLNLTRSELIDFFSNNLNRKDFSIEMKQKKSGKNCGWAVLKVKSKKLCKKILRQKFFSIKGSKITVKPFMTGKKLHSFKNNLNKRRIFLKGVPNSYTDVELFSHFEQFGKVEDAYLVKRQGKKKTKSGTCYGFVILEKEEDAIRLLEIGSMEVGGRPVSITPYRSKKEKSKIQKTDGKGHPSAQNRKEDKDLKALSKEIKPKNQDWEVRQNSVACYKSKEPKLITQNYQHSPQIKGSTFNCDGKEKLRMAKEVWHCQKDQAETMKRVQLYQALSPNGFNNSRYNQPSKNKANYRTMQDLNEGYQPLYSKKPEVHRSRFDHNSFLRRTGMKGTNSKPSTDPRNLPNLDFSDKNGKIFSTWEFFSSKRRVEQNHSMNNLRFNELGIRFQNKNVILQLDEDAFLRR